MLLEIWADNTVSRMLMETHRNSEVFNLFSDKLRENGIEWTVEQCQLKVKKLRQQYIKVCNALYKTGSSGEEKDKFPWYDFMDTFLETKLTSNPKDVVESYEETPSTSPVTPTPAEEEDGGSSDDTESVKGKFVCVYVCDHLSRFRLFCTVISVLVPRHAYQDNVPLFHSLAKNAKTRKNR